MRDDLSRREVLKIGVAAVVPAVASSNAEALAFFTPHEFALVDELSELIIPADAHSPGARAAKVAAFIDGRIAEVWEAADKEKWRGGLKLVDQMSEQMSGHGFLESSADQRVATLMRMSQNEDNPKTPEELFFRELKARIVNAYYTSEIGIRREMEYKGNTYQNQFAGSDVS